MRIRRDAGQLHDDTLSWYGRGIAALQLRPLSDPRSWRYQAAIHEYTRAADPYAAAGDALPKQAEQDRFWNQCQHASWFFLPWHRMYLHHFEAIVAAEIAALGGPADWALPYWNPAGSPDQRAPPSARSPPNTRPGG